MTTVEYFAFGTWIITAPPEPWRAAPSAQAAVDYELARGGGHAQIEVKQVRVIQEEPPCEKP